MRRRADNIAAIVVFIPGHPGRHAFCNGGSASSDGLPAMTRTDTVSTDPQHEVGATADRATPVILGEFTAFKPIDENAGVVTGGGDERARQHGRDDPSSSEPDVKRQRAC